MRRSHARQAEPMLAPGMTEAEVDEALRRRPAPLPWRALVLGLAIAAVPWLWGFLALH